MRKIKSELFVRAPIEHVWSAIIDFNHWKEWNPTITEASGESALGSRLSITMRGKDGKAANTYKPKVIEFNAPNQLRWTANMGANFLFKNDRVFLLEAKDGGTQITQTEEFSGVLVPMMWRMLEGFVGPTLDKVNQALKEKLESKS